MQNSDQNPACGRAEWVAVDLRCILAPNPSPMTGRGTNSYLLGQTELALIDPGPNDPAHLDAILAAVGPGQKITHILVTHAHRDHSGLAPGLARATGAPVLAFGPADAGRSLRMQALAQNEVPIGGEGVDHAFQPDRTLADGDEISGAGWRMTALHTPGHFGNHLCLVWQDQVFCGDHVMGWSSSVIAPPDGDMGAYLTSLDRLAALQAATLWPGHGDAVKNPAERIAELTSHRRARGTAILAQLQNGPADASGLAQAIYHDTPASLMRAAAMNVFAHLIDFTERNLAEPIGQIGFSSRFRAR